MMQRYDTAIGYRQPIHQRTRSVGRAVVNQNNDVDKSGQPLDYTFQVLLHFITRNSYRNLLLLVHRCFRLMLVAENLL